MLTMNFASSKHFHGKGKASANTGRDHRRNVWLQSLLRFNRSEGIACSSFVVAATIYHVWPNPIIGAVVLLFNVILAVRFPILLVWIVTYGYLLHPEVAPGLVREIDNIPFAVPAMASLFLLHGRSRSSAIQLRTRHIAIVLCCALGVVMILSQIADPVVRNVEAVFIRRLFNIALCLLVAGSIKTEAGRWHSILALSAFSTCLALNVAWLALTKGLISVYTRHVAGIVLADPNYLAFNLCIGLGPLFVVSASSATKSQLGRLLSLACGLAILWGVLLTTSRMGSILVGMILLLALTRSLRLKLLSAVLLSAFVLASAFLVYPLLSSMPQFSQLERRWQSRDIATASGRTDIASGALEAFATSSATQVLVGGGTQANYVKLGANTHDSYLEFLLDHGVLGMGLLVALLFVALQNIWRTPSLPVSTSMWAVWLTLIIGSLALSPFAYSAAWVGLAPLLVSPVESARKMTR